MPVIEAPRSAPVGTTRRSYTLVFDSDADRPLPLILAFHGSASSGGKLRGLLDGSLDRLVEEGRAVVAYLDGYKGHWNDSRTQSDFKARQDSVDDLGYVQTVVDTLAAEGKADPQRVTAFGFSQGGQMVLRLLHDRPALLRGAAIVAASMPTAENWMSVGEPADVPLLLIAGTKDRCSPYAGGDATLFGFASRGPHVSSLGTAQYFAAARGLDSAPVVSQPPHRPESGDKTVTIRQWGEGRHLIRHYEIAGGGHTIPLGTKVNKLLTESTTADIDTGTEFATYVLGA